MNMFSQSKPTASLSSGLLARKGQAKPAMRPQGFGGFGAIPAAQDDLGWNDMGDTEPTPLVASVPPVLMQREVLREEIEAPVAAEADVEPAPVEAAPVETAPVETAPVETAPVEAARVVAIKSISVATAARIGRDTGRQHKKNHLKSAFTLRLDADRHLRLRLASALHNASAQTLVTEALDLFLQSVPEVDDLLRQIPARARR